MDAIYSTKPVSQDTRKRGNRTYMTWESACSQSSPCRLVGQPFPGAYGKYIREAVPVCAEYTNSCCIALAPAGPTVSRRPSRLKANKVRDISCVILLALSQRSSRTAGEKMRTSRGEAWLCQHVRRSRCTLHSNGYLQA